MYSQLLLVSLFVLTMTLLRAMRHASEYPRLYILILAVSLMLGIAGLDERGTALGVVAIGVTSFAVVLPHLLDILGKVAFERGRLGIATATAGMRGHLMMGGGGERQRQIWHGLRTLEQKGIDAAIDEFRGLCASTEDESELRLLQEHILSLYLLAGRWSDGIEYFERSFPTDYPLIRPGLAGTLVRAYTELGRFDDAQRVLRLLSEAPWPLDPKADQGLARARIAYLAGVANVEAIESLLTQGARQRLGMSASGAELALAVAKARAGRRSEAVDHLEAVRALAGPQERFNDAMTAVVRAALQDGPATIPESAANYAAKVRDDLREYMARAPVIVVQRVPVVTLFSMFLCALLFGVVSMDGGGLSALLKWGLLTPELWAAGRYHRTLISPWLHVDFLGLVLDLYLIWLAGQVGERVYGALRYALSMLVAPALALGITSLLQPEAAGAGARSALAVAAITVSFWAIRMTDRAAGGRGSRRGLTIALTLLLAANLLGAASNFLGSAAAMMTLVLTATIVSVFHLGFDPSKDSSMTPRWKRAAVWALVVGWCSAAVTARAGDPRSDLVRAEAKTCRLDNVALQIPMSFRVASDELALTLPVSDLRGFADALAWQSRAFVQFGVVDVAAPKEELGLALFTKWPALADNFSVTAVSQSIPEPFAGLARADANHWRFRDMRRDGELVARVVERELQTDHGVRTVVLISNPARSLAELAEVYAQVMAGAQNAGSEVGECPIGAKRKGGTAAAVSNPAQDVEAADQREEDGVGRSTTF